MLKKITINRPTSIRTAIAFGAALILFGLALFGFQLFNLWRSQQSSASPQSINQILDTSSVNEQPAISGTPIRVSVPSVNIDLEVIPGYHNPKSQTWTLSLDKAQWGVMTKPANDKSGMTFIYGHYRKGVFANLPKIKPGQVAQIRTDNGYTFTYSFRASSVVSPADVSTFKYQGKPILILQTCTGIRFEDRQLFVFDLISVE